MSRSLASGVDNAGGYFGMETSTVVRDAAIKRFEYNFELTWKIIKRFASIEGYECDSPRQAFKIALKLNWIDDDNVWLDMLEDRNRTTHTYQEVVAEEIYNRIDKYYKAMTKLHERLSRQD